MKLYMFVTIVTGIMILMSLAGINTTGGYVLNKLGLIDNIENFQNSTLYLGILAVFAAVSVGGLIIGYFTKTSPESYLVAPVAAILILFVGDLISIVTYSWANYPNWVSYIVLLLSAPLVIGYTISAIDWWRGVG